MNFTFTGDQEAFRAEVRACLEETLTKEVWEQQHAERHPGCQLSAAHQEQDGIWRGGGWGRRSTWRRSRTRSRRAPAKFSAT